MKVPAATMMRTSERHTRLVPNRASLGASSEGRFEVLGEAQMFSSILVPLDLADTDLARPALATAATLSQTWSGKVRLLNVLPMTPVMLAEYVPADFDVQQRQTSEEALAIVAQESGIDASRISTSVRQGG